jgi:hypothetical protein
VDNRKLNFVSPWLVMLVVICEDLARPDPGASHHSWAFRDTTLVAGAVNLVRCYGPISQSMNDFHYDRAVSPALLAARQWMICAFAYDKRDGLIPSHVPVPYSASIAIS